MALFYGHSEALSLFILVRDVPRFNEMYAKEVLALVKDLGFTGPMKEPQRIVQEGCLPFDPNITPSGVEARIHVSGLMYFTAEAFVVALMCIPGWVALATFNTGVVNHRLLIVPPSRVPVQKLNCRPQPPCARRLIYNVDVTLLVLLTPTDGIKETPEWVDFFLQEAPEGVKKEVLKTQAVQGLSEERNDFVPKSWWKYVRTVAALDVDRYTGRWYQVRLKLGHALIPG